MLENLTAVILAVRDADAASKTFEAIFAAERAETHNLANLGADVTLLKCGTDLIGIAVPTGPGPIAAHLDRRGEGIVGVVFGAKDVDALHDRFKSKGVSFETSHDVTLIDPARTHGLLTMIAPHHEREQTGLVSFIYEVTHLVDDWEDVSDFWTDLFGLEGAKFSPIKSDQYGYEGTLTLFDPPDKLDRIEVVYPGDETKAMGKFFRKRGEGPYMFFVETDDMPALRERLRSIGARHAPEKEPEQPNSLFIHPSATHGVLIGVSPKNLAWVWSGRPELAKAKA
jgi:catechol 2,3-dioxygenase-like lactoylglutathione lyase family enzyme